MSPGKTLLAFFVGLYIGALIGWKIFNGQGIEEPE